MATTTNNIREDLVGGFVNAFYLGTAAQELMDTTGLDLDVTYNEATGRAHVVLVLVTKTDSTFTVTWTYDAAYIEGLVHSYPDDEGVDVIIEQLLHDLGYRMLKGIYAAEYATANP